MGSAYLELSALDLLKEEMLSDETYVKVNSIHRLKTIATVLGPEAVKQQLMPYLSSNRQHRLNTRGRRGPFCLSRVLRRHLPICPVFSCPTFKLIRSISGS
jgi:hypothetical protein